MIPTNFLATGSGNLWMTIGMIVVVIVVFYFFGIRPQKKQEQAAAQMRNELTVGDEMTTIGGIIGKIVSIKDETMVIETGRDHTRMRLLKSAVRNVDVHAVDSRDARKTVADNSDKQEKKD